MATTGSLHSPQPTLVGDEISSIRRKIDVVRAAFEAAAEALELLCAAELEVLVRSPDFGQDVDFYDLVRRFESNLIRRALNHSEGVQSRAARLLNIKPTTLNNKIKVYDLRREPHFFSLAEKTISADGLEKTRTDLVA
jgi:DNA-binding protein Fis